MKNYFMIVLASAVLTSCAHANEHNEIPPLQTVPFVNVEKYLGQWFEIARFEQKFQKDCVATTATYSMESEGRIEVVNQCRVKTLDGKLKTAKGHAKIVDASTNAKLKVTFFWPFYGKYWIIDLGENYEYAVVGHPDRTYLWILSRTPHIAPEVYSEILRRLEAQHYDTSKLLVTLQPSQ